ncbi:signal transduction histidine kinase [Pseudoduganella lurida]|uniref:histidine kinase n=1 Tax=Pseudoduganella lurida TaxID=1036180 RepID=A0A562R9E5_9BURK|nr:two-component regulator propeller domain-containing protein [Pseudoduganella lurida]TWI65204.1 signal transduction histidine kinase [Pseudoduganella lurida]
MVRSVSRPLLATLCLLLALICAAGSATAAPPRTLRFEQLNVDGGLPQESVLAIAQDRQGFMWFGTQAGLARFDGYRTVIYQNALSDPASLAENWVRVLHVDPSGRLWIGTDAGLDLFDPLTQRFTHYRPAEPEQRGNGNRHVRAIIDDGAGGLWLGTADGLQRFDPASGRFTIWHNSADDPDSLAQDQINTLARDRAGRLWIGTPGGVDMLAPDSRVFRHYTVTMPGQARPVAVQSLMVDRDDTLWVGSHAGLERWHAGAGDGEAAPRRERLPAAAGLPAGAVMNVYQDMDGVLWVGMRNEGLLRWHPATARFVRYRHKAGDPHSLADDNVSALYRDRVGTFWVGTWYNGVSRIDLSGGGFARLVKDPDEPGSLADNRVRAIVDAGGGKLWIGNNDGLSLYDPLGGGSSLYRLPQTGNGASDAHVTALWRAPRAGGGATLWVGGRTGVRTFDPATSRFGPLLLSRGNPELDTVRYVYGDRAGAIWVSSKAGLYRIDPDGAIATFRHDPADPHSLADNTVRPVLEDRQGNLWVGTFHGLDLLDRRTGRFTHFRHDRNDPYSLSHNEVHYLYEDAQGTLWVGTASGLNRMEPARSGEGKAQAPRFHRTLRQDGLADDSIAAILADRQGKLWLSTNIGLSSFEIANRQVRNFSGVDGTIEGAYFDGSALAAPDGTLYFGGFNGITAFDPAAVRANGIAPAVAITDFQILNQSVRPGMVRPDGRVTLPRAIEATNELTLGQNDSVFSLEFAALHYASPQNNRYAYRLQGFDRGWVATGANKRFATYTNLDPGRYVFQVRAANKDGVWSAPATVAITILPPLWKTWWVRTLALLLVLGAAFGLYRARVRNLRGQRARLEQQVSLRTAEVEMKNHLLIEQKRELEQRDERLRQAAQRAEDATRQKSEFLANMSHEMRTPLAGVIGMLGFALRDPVLPHGTREQIQRGQANAQSLLSLINDLLDFSKIEAGKLSIENIDFALAITVENVVSLFGEQAAAQAIDFHVDYGDGLPRFVVGDPTRLRQVLVNLVGNAFKFTQRGQVVLRVHPDATSCGAGCTRIRFTVEDTGIGIPPEELPRLFEKFEQADATTTRRYGGTGLGLAICRQLVDLMGGEIGAVSTPDVGSVFTVTLPLQEGVAPAPLPQVAHAPHTHSLKVLCAEDFPTNQMIIRTMLEDLGHRVDIVGNGALAVAACAQTRYDLILMDGRMPEMDGLTATRMIRSGGPASAPVWDRDLMIVALTANASEEDRSRYLAAGMDDFLTKPIDEAALHLQLTRAVERQQRRGIVLPPLPARPPKAQPGVADLDAMFGVDTLERIPVPPPARRSPRADGEEARALRLRLRDAFIADLPGRLNELDAALAAADADAAGRLFHGMKGSAAYLQEVELQALCAELERAADRALWPAIRHKLPRLHEALGRILAPVGDAGR